MSEVESFFKSAFSVDNVIFGFDGGDLKVLLIQRGAAPFRGKWALPGDLVYPNEDLNTAAERVLEQLTGLRGVYLEQVRTFGAVNRHPLGRVITIAYFSLIKVSDFALTRRRRSRSLPIGTAFPMWVNWLSTTMKSWIFACNACNEKCAMHPSDLNCFLKNLP